MGDVHRDLVLRACRWLAKTERCVRVYAEVQSMMISEFPDAIGYRSSGTWGRTIVVEAKASVADFKRDASKQWKAMQRIHAGQITRGEETTPLEPRHLGMGSSRYYIMPDGMVPESDIPADHGLLYAMPNGRVKRVRKAPLREARDTESEISILCTMLQRYELGCQWIPAEYRFETERERLARMCEDTLDAVEVTGRAIGGADA